VDRIHFGGVAGVLDELEDELELESGEVVDDEDELGFMSVLEEPGWLELSLVEPLVGGVALEPDDPVELPIEPLEEVEPLPVCVESTGPRPPLLLAPRFGSTLGDGAGGVA
jgi:hypothetical protein